MLRPTWTTFPALSRLPGFAHRFTLRNPEIDVNAERDVVVKRLWTWHRSQAQELGFDPDSLCIAEQVHGNRVLAVNGPQTSPAPGADGLVCNLPEMVIGIYVADCCAVYLVDEQTGAFGVVHSGKKGTELGITRHAIEQMQRCFGSQPANMIVQLSPCIRPPAYEVDFAAEIQRQAQDAGVPVSQIHDAGECTSSDLQRFYSYRMEKGRTGRMLALLGRHA
ncbi:MAG: polyphenol oxidase family protein [Prosthecobacter sp.]